MTEESGMIEQAEDGESAMTGAAPEDGEIVMFEEAAE